MEVDSQGNFRFDYTKFPQFSLIDVPKAFFEAMEIAKEKTDGGYFWGDKCSGELINIALAESTNSCQDFWNNDDLFYTVYRNAQYLKEMNIQLLYFLPPDNYLRTLPRYYDEPDESYDQLVEPWYESPL